MYRSFSPDTLGKEQDELGCNLGHKLISGLPAIVIVSVSVLFSLHVTSKKLRESVQLIGIVPQRGMKRHMKTAQRHPCRSNHVNCHFKFILAGETVWNASGAEDQLHVCFDKSQGGLVQRNHRRLSMVDLWCRTVEAFEEFGNNVNHAEGKKKTNFSAKNCKRNVSIFFSGKNPLQPYIIKHSLNLKL